ncbi:hypothetical protein [Cedecea lapagei]|uniref:hypothetical protein n=1 Tax=Cedecea lapagei TaxID=158823 RepID=UPI001BCE0482|nr:hypothetical protein [Cedecea lapagei]
MNLLTIPELNSVTLNITVNYNIEHAVLDTMKEITIDGLKYTIENSFVNDETLTPNDDIQWSKKCDDVYTKTYVLKSIKE